MVNSNDLAALLIDTKVIIYILPFIPSVSYTHTLTHSNTHTKTGTNLYKVGKMSGYFCTYFFFSFNKCFYPYCEGKNCCTGNSEHFLLYLSFMKIFEYFLEIQLFLLSGRGKVILMRRVSHHKSIANSLIPSYKKGYFHCKQKSFLGKQKFTHTLNSYIIRLIIH